MDPRLRELLDKGIPALTYAELGELSSLAEAHVEGLSGVDLTGDQISEIRQIGAAVPDLKAELAARATDGPAGENVRESILDALAAPAEAVEVEPVAASARPRPVPLSQVRTTPAAHREPPVQPGSGLTASLVASSGVPADRDMTDRTHFIEEMTRQLGNTKGYSGGRMEEVVVSAKYSLPDDIRQFGSEGSQAREYMDQRITAMTASGGLCRPVTVDYSIPTWSNTARPVRAALPAFQALRGGLQFGIPPVYSLSTYGQGVAVWSAANDVNPGGSGTGPNSNPTGTGPTVKPSLEIDCGAFMEVDVEAITQSITLSNFRGRFSPENVNAAMVYLEQAFSATAEIELLRQMRAFCKHTSFTQEFGVARDSLAAFDRVGAYFRDFYRLSDTVILRVVLKSWVKNAIRTDLAKAAFPGMGNNISLAVTDAQIEDWFAVRGLAPIWTLDDDTGDQSIAAMSAGTTGSPVALSGYPAFFRALIYPEGTFQLLDGGELNLGVVRDSALNSVNKYQVFSESFEAIAARGFEAQDLKIGFLANGASAGTVTPA